MSRLPPVAITIYPYECDAYGHLNEAAFLEVFARARWETLARGPGLQAFRRNGIWPAVRKAQVEFFLPVWPGDVLDVHTELLKLGRTSMELRHRAVRQGDAQTVAEADLVFVIVDGSGNPAPVPEEIAALFATRVSTRSGEVVRYDVGDTSLAVDVRGDGPALLLIHGYPLDRTIWKHQVATLAGWRRIAPDLRGMGMSEATDGTYSMATYADDLVRLLDRLRVGKVVVAGHSMGGYIAFEMLRRYRDRISGLILCDTRASADTREGAAARDESVKLAQARGAEAVAEKMLPVLLGATTQQTQPQVVQQVRDMIVRTPVPGIVGALGAMKERPDSTPLLAGIDVRTLVVVGSEDAIAPPAVSRAMADAIPAAAMTIIPGAGHIAPLEAPTAVSRVIAEFLEVVRDPDA